MMGTGNILSKQLCKMFRMEKCVQFIKWCSSFSHKRQLIFTFIMCFANESLQALHNMILKDICKNCGKFYYLTVVQKMFIGETLPVVFKQ